MTRGWTRFLALLLLLTPSAAAAHHGVATLGAAGLEGPGAPLETSTSMPLPRGSILTYFKLDHARWERYTIRRDEESIYSTFWLFGLGYGVRSWLSCASTKVMPKATRVLVTRKKVNSSSGSTPPR